MRILSIITPESLEKHAFFLPSRISASLKAELTESCTGSQPDYISLQAKRAMADYDGSIPDGPMNHATIRQKIEHALESTGGLLRASLRPLPTQTGDGSYLAPPQITGLIKDLHKMGIDDAETLIELVKTTATGEKINDKSYFMERLIKLASELPMTSKNGVKLTNSLVNKLWSDLQHPPSTFLGEEYIYRRADGSYNVYTPCHMLQP